MYFTINLSSLDILVNYGHCLLLILGIQLEVGYLICTLLIAIIPSSLFLSLRFVGGCCGLLFIFELSFLSSCSSLLHACHNCYQQDNKATARYDYINHNSIIFLIIIQNLAILRVFNFSVIIMINGLFLLSFLNPMVYFINFAFWIFCKGWSSTLLNWHLILSHKLYSLFVIIDFFWVIIYSEYLSITFQS